jgi:hypothetical protein
VTEPNLPAVTDEQIAELERLHAENRGRDAVALREPTRHRLLPANAYIRPGLGDLPLSTQLRAAFRLLNETLLPLIDSVEAQQPQVVQCSVCYRNLGGWPVRILEEHYYQHSWLQRRLAKVGIR